MNTFLKVFLTQRLQFCVYFILDVQKANKEKVEKEKSEKQNKTSKSRSWFSK
ncbi:hypothetical protein [Spiroplasma endosymbiont of Aleiodes alternator]|uniref:hypothetical protein n=1 Tax=Spiroplasma endosymbiont of Aleiodes alternator TaxID=3139329 RepID=UPI003CCB4140